MKNKDVYEILAYLLAVAVLISNMLTLHTVACGNPIRQALCPSAQDTLFTNLIYFSGDYCGFGG
jgi:hypothetical protein